MPKFMDLELANACYGIGLNTGQTENYCGGLRMWLLMAVAPLILLILLAGNTPPIRVPSHN